MTVEEFDLIFDPTPDNTDIAYMRDQYNPEWKIGEMAKPVYLYQPDVEPTPDGGRVKLPARREHKRDKRQFIPAEKKLDPEEQQWKLISNDGTQYTGRPDTLDNFAVMMFEGQGVISMKLVNRSYRFFKEPPRRFEEPEDAEMAAKDEAMKMKHRRGQLQVDKLLTAREENIVRLRVLEQERVDMRVDLPSDRGSEDDRDPHGSGDSDVDFTYVRDSDEEIAFSDLDLFDELSDAVDDSSDDGAEEEIKENEEEKKPAPVVVPIDESQTTAEHNEKIVEAVMGPRCVKEEELIAFVADLGIVTLADIRVRFKSQLRTKEQIEAMKDLIRKTMRPVENNYFSLKIKRK